MNRIQRTLFGVRRAPTRQYGNLRLSYTAVCPSGTTGFPVTLTAPANTFFSAVSQADANQQALAAMVVEANARLVCSGATLYWNTFQTVTLTCPDGQVGSYTATVPANTFSSDVSVAAANAIALASATAEATAELACETPPDEGYCNEAVTACARCPRDTAGSGICVTIEAAADDGSGNCLYWDADSQATANSLAMAAAQAAADALLTPELCVPLCEHASTTLTCTVDEGNPTLGAWATTESPGAPMNFVAITLLNSKYPSVPGAGQVSIYGADNATPDYVIGDALILPTMPIYGVGLRVLFPMNAPTGFSYAYYKATAAWGDVQVQFLSGCLDGGDLTMVPNTEQTVTVNCTDGTGAHSETSTVSAGYLYASTQSEADFLAHQIASDQCWSALHISGYCLDSTGEDTTTSGECAKAIEGFAQWNSFATPACPAVADSTPFYIPKEGEGYKLRIAVSLRHAVAEDVSGTLYVYATAGAVDTALDSISFVIAEGNMKPDAGGAFDTYGYTYVVVPKSSSNRTVRAEVTSSSSAFCGAHPTAEGHIYVDVCSVGSGEIRVLDAAAGAPYPGTRVVPASYNTNAGTTLELRVKLSHGFIGDLALLAQHPNGSYVELLRNIWRSDFTNDGHGVALTNVWLRFAHSSLATAMPQDPTGASALLSDTSYLLAISTYNEAGDSPASTLNYALGSIPYGHDFSALTSVPPAGLWRLYARDDYAGGSGVILDWGIWKNGVRISN